MLTLSLGDSMLGAEGPLDMFLSVLTTLPEGCTISQPRSSHLSGSQPSA